MNIDINKMFKKVSEDDYEEYYIRNGRIYERFIKEHDKGHRPIDYIEKSYFEDLKLKELHISMRFFKWYLKKHCNTCDCEPCGCDKNSCKCENYENYDAEVMELNFYDIVACSENLKKEDINKLKLEYKNDTSKKNMSSEYFYAKIEYFKSPNRAEKKRYEDYAIVYRGWAYMKPNGTNHKVKIKATEEQKEYDTHILNQYFRRPEEMSKSTADGIIDRLSKSNHNLKLAKPPKKEK